jgi:P-type Cu2+ transporter
VTLAHGATGAAGAHGDDDTHGDDTHGAHDHGGHAGHDPEAFRRLFWVTLVLSIPVVFTSDMVMDWLGYSLSGVGWVAPVLGTVVFFYGGQPFLKGAVDELRVRMPGMMLLIGMAITVGWVASLASSFGWVDLEFWWELAALVTIMLLGHWQEMKAIGQAQNALHALAELLPDQAERVAPDGAVESVAIDALRVGDVVLVRSGGRVPADGHIVEGTAELDESMITGESRAVAKTPNDRVVAGTVVLDSSVRVHVDAVGDDTALAGIQRLVAEAQASRSRAQALADRFAALLFYFAAGSAVVTVIAWLAVGDVSGAIEHAVTVLVVACPHALGLAIPLVVSISTAVAARAGILVKDRLALERMRTVQAVLFDKTGTLTKGRPVVSDVLSVERDRDELLRIAAAVEADSEHPLARAIVAAADSNVRVASSFRSLTGRGVEAVVDDVAYAVGGPALLRERSLGVPSALERSSAEWSARGATVLYVARGGEVIGAIALEDEIRPEAKESVDALHHMGIRPVVMITGDARPVADRVAAAVGVDEVVAEVLPQDKEHAVSDLQQRGLMVAMVGDGVNDAPALARADVGVAIGAGTDVAMESAGVVLASSDPRGVAAVVRLSRASYRKMIQNLAWAAGYNVLVVPLAAGGLAWAGISMPPAVGAVLMSLSTIIVAANAQMLRRLDLRPGATTVEESPEAAHRELASLHRQ